MALRCGLALTGMEFVQFTPTALAHPEPLAGTSTGGVLLGLPDTRLWNAKHERFMERYDPERKEASTRAILSRAIQSEVVEGRGTPHGGVWLSFRHCGEADLRSAFGPVIDRLAANGIDLTRDLIEVAPIAHYHMGGIRVDSDMATGVPQLFAAGEAVGGANGANRLSGNAITEAFTFGRRAGLRAAQIAAKEKRFSLRELKPRPIAFPDINPAAEIVNLQRMMNEHVGPLRNAAGLARALEQISALSEACEALPPPRGGLDPQWIDLHDLRNMRLVAECVTRAALARAESRGAHQREDFPETRDAWQRHQRICGSDGKLRIEN
jgi:succinate dehydrogenase/fumarate reductase flavoprotein subunit